MAKIAVTEVPVEVPDIDTGVWYLYENVGDVPVYLDVLADAPVNPGRDDGNEIVHGNAGFSRTRNDHVRPRGRLEAKRLAAEKVFVWAYGGPATLKVSVSS